MENTGHSGKSLESNIHLTDTKTDVEVNIMYKCYGKLEKSLFNHLISLQKNIPVELAQYVIENGVLNKPGWKRFKHYKQWQKQVERLIHQVKLQSYRLCTK